MAISKLIKKLLMTTAGVGLISLGSVGSAKAATIVRGSITKPDEQTTTVDHWNFTVNTASQVTINVLAWNFDFGNGPSGLDSYLYLFHDDGVLDISDYIVRNDDHGGIDAFSDGTTFYYDSYLSNFMNPGKYILAISNYSFRRDEAVDGIQTDYNLLSTNNGDYQITFTGDITLASVPEPTSTLGLLAFGALGAGSMLKRKQQKNA